MTVFFENHKEYEALLQEKLETVLRKASITRTAILVSVAGARAWKAGS